MNAFASPWHMTRRKLQSMIRQPWYLAITLVQPIIWLLLFGALFKKIVDIPGFHGGSYIDFLTPGIVVMTALFSSGWSGMGMLGDLERRLGHRALARGYLLALTILCGWFATRAFRTYQRSI
jgi:ABC-2 type transport system permease protein